MKTLVNVFLVLILLGAEAQSQFIPSVSHTLRYGEGKRTLGMINQDYKYFENLTDVRIGLPANFTAGIRLLYDTPPEVGLEHKGLKRRFVEYDGNTFFARAGDFSQLYGRGLALNLFENRGLGYDSWADGFNLQYKHEYFRMNAIYATLDFQDSIEIARDEEHKIRGGLIQIFPLEMLSVGLSYIYSNSGFKLFGETQTAEINIPSFYLDFSFSDFNFLFDFALKETDNISTSKKSVGRAYYGALSYFGDGLGITLDYKNYSFDERDPFEKYDITRPTRMLPFQNAPIVIKEHSYTLLTRAIHEVDFNDETGFQLEILKNLGENTDLNFNASISSRHSYYKFDQNNFSFSKFNGSFDFLPSFSSEYSPYWEVFGEVVHYFDTHTYAKLALARREKIFYDEFFEGKNNHVIKSTIIPVQFNHSFSSFYSLDFHLEYENVFDNFNVQQESYNNYLITLINAFNSIATLTLRYELTNNRFDVSEKRNWFTIESGIRIIQEVTVVASYGRERGGQVCSNGVCRYIQPFEGFRFSVIASI